MNRPGQPEPNADPNAELFDGYAHRYANVVNQSISASGEDVAFFAFRKAEEVARRLASRATRPIRVLDFGCGTGVSTHALSQTLGRNATVDGIDVSPVSIATAQRDFGSERIRFATCDEECIPFADGTFDVVFTACVFHHIERSQHERWAAELARVTRAGGLTFIFEHNPLNPVTVRAVRACPFDEGVVLLRPGYTRRLLARTGLVTERPRFYFFFPRPLAALRTLEPALDGLPLGAQYFVCGGKR